MRPIEAITNFVYVEVTTQTLVQTLEVLEQERGESDENNHESDSGKSIE